MLQVPCYFCTAGNTAVEVRKMTHDYSTYQVMTLAINTKLFTVTHYIKTHGEIINWI